MKILAINPGSTSTKLAVYEKNKLLFEETVRHSDEEIMKFADVADQLAFRMETIKAVLLERGFPLTILDAVVGRGGMLKPLSSGTYIVGESILEDARSGKYGNHASNLGPILSAEIGAEHNIPAYIVDPVGVDELMDEARISGLVDIERKSHVHALNIKAVSRKIAIQIGRNMPEANFVIAHLGGGISVAALQGGRIVDVNNAENEGPFSPERAGGLPAKQLVHLCYSGKYTEKELIQRITKQGGIFSYLGTKSVIEVEKRALDGDTEAELTLKAMIHQIGKEIGAMATVLEGRIDGIILTGGIAHSDRIVGWIREKIRFLGEVFVVPGEAEMEALAAGAFRVLTGEEEAKIY
ncbi:butyrate kinase [Mesobacillus subterraneus]|uniref:butyrate kinase n=1 Tax=Mesobacillus subterraneus TaxID=285983 RepID=UPI00203FDBB2|nr:butyrate kinase [Mesobacillus subterraneus]MCM3666756.1 butyrate kinase [Mesobacillus subterraneus]MCM3685652.1 butyrate kinase [Mesobacillus subterraneus]